MGACLQLTKSTFKAELENLPVIKNSKTDSRQELVSIENHMYYGSTSNTIYRYDCQANITPYAK